MDHISTATTLERYVELLEPMILALKAPSSLEAYESNRDEFHESIRERACYNLECYSNALREERSYLPMMCFHDLLSVAQALFAILEQTETKPRVCTETFPWCSPWERYADSAVEYALIVCSFDFESDETTFDFNASLDLEQALLAFIEFVRPIVSEQDISTFVNDSIKGHTDKESMLPESLSKMILVDA